MQNKTESCPSLFASWGFLFASAGAHSICAPAACGNYRGRIWDPPYEASIWTFVNITKKRSESRDALYVFALALNRWSVLYFKALNQLRRRDPREETRVYT